MGQVFHYVMRAGLTVVIVVLLGLSTLVATVPAYAKDESPEKPLVGRWYGEGFQPGVRKYLKWIMERTADGNFVVEFREYEDCLLKSRNVESGTWSYDGKIYSTHTLFINLHGVNYIDRYEISELTDLEMDYRNVRSRTDFHAIKVGTAFKMPPCLST